MGRVGKIASRALSFLLRLPVTTPEGRFFLGGVVALGFLATTTDRNYVLLVLGLLIGVVLVSVVGAGLNLRQIRFSRSMPEAVEAGESFSVRVRVENGRRWFPARGVELKDALQTGRSGRESRCFAPLIPAGGRVTFEYPARISRRGVYNVTNALLATRFPFGLFTKRALARHASRIVVYPRTGEIDGGKLPGSRDVHVVLRERSMARPGGDEFRGLRDYRPGDDPRRIAWRASARQQRLVLKELSQENRGKVAVLLATSLAGIPLRERRRSLESAVSLAGSLVRHLHRIRRPFLLGTLEGVVDSLGRTETLGASLTMLAVLRARPEASATAVVRAAGFRRLRGCDVLLVVPGRETGEIPEVPGARIHAVASRSGQAFRMVRGRRR